MLQQIRIVELASTELLRTDEYGNYSIYGFNIFLDRHREPFLVHIFELLLSISYSGFHGYRLMTMGDYF
jgi:hypothetical protein